MHKMDLSTQHYDLFTEIPYKVLSVDCEFCGSKLRIVGVELLDDGITWDIKEPN